MATLSVMPCIKYSTANIIYDYIGGEFLMFIFHMGTIIILFLCK